LITKVQLRAAASMKLLSRDALDPAQRSAATGTGRYQLILAGPGSGKTTPLAGRFVHLVHKGSDRRRILLPLDLEPGNAGPVIGLLSAANHGRQILGPPGASGVQEGATIYLTRYFLSRGSCDAPEQLAPHGGAYLPPRRPYSRRARPANASTPELCGCRVPDCGGVRRAQQPVSFHTLTEGTAIVGDIDSL